MEAIIEPIGSLPVSDPAALPDVDGRQRAEFIALYTREYPRVLGYVLRRVGDRSVAEDLTAEVFRISWERLTEVLGTPGWIFGTARNLVMAQHRQIQRTELLRQRLTTEHGRSEDGPGADGREAEVWAALDRLPADQRELLISYYWDDLSGADCAALQGCSVGAVWVRLHRARAALRIELDESKDE